MAILPGCSPCPYLERRGANSIAGGTCQPATGDAASDAAGTDTDAVARHSPGAAAGHADHRDAECRADSCNFARRAVAGARAIDEHSSAHSSRQRVITAWSYG